LDKPKIKDQVGLKLSNFKGVIAMMSDIPIDLTKVKKANIDKEILRVAIIAELDAINLYEQMAAITENKDINGCGQRRKNSCRRISDPAIGRR